MISGRDIIYISSIEWDFVWQGHQEIAIRFARAGNRVLYIENTGVRSPRLSDSRRVINRLGKWIESLESGGVRSIEDNLHVCSPLVLPPFGPSWRQQINRHLLLPLIKRAARKLGMRDPLIWTYLPTDTALNLVRMLRTPQSRVIYYCIADFSQLTPYRVQLRESERALIETSDIVFAQNNQLAKHCMQYNSNVHIFPFGVNLQAFPFEREENGHALGDDAVRRLQSLPRPIIGYVGGLHRHVDFDLVVQMARARAHWSWLFIGPKQTDLRELSALPNVHIFGQLPHERLVFYIREFDVCIVPYIQNSYTETVLPTKINEYLAVGKPVVSTELPSVREFNDRHKILTLTPATPEAFLRAIEEALQAPDDATARSRRRAVAALADWSSRLEKMCAIIERHLAAGSDAFHAR